MLVRRNGMRQTHYKTAVLRVTGFVNQKGHAEKEYSERKFSPVWNTLNFPRKMSLGNSCFSIVYATIVTDHLIRLGGMFYIYNYTFV